MSQVTSIRELYGVEVDQTDWPAGLPNEEKEELCRIVVEILRKHGSMHMSTLVRVIGADHFRARLPVWSKAALLDWIYGCVERACRAAHAERHWLLEPDHPAMTGPRGDTATATAADLASSAKAIGMRQVVGLKAAIGSLKFEETNQLARVLALRVAKDHPELAASIARELRL